MSSSAPASGTVLDLSGEGEQSEHTPLGTTTTTTTATTASPLYTPTTCLSGIQQPNAYIKTVASEDAARCCSPLLQQLYNKWRNPDGSLDNILTIHSINPPALEAHFELYSRALHGDSPLTRVEREVVAVAVSLENKCRY